MAYKKEEFDFEEDYPVSGECEDCDYITDVADELETQSCPECDGTLLITTAHEGTQCDICNGFFNSYEDAYRNIGDPTILICEDCYNDLEE